MTLRMNLFIITTFLYLDVVLSSICPSVCDCFDNNTSIICSVSGLKEVPKGLPNTTIKLDLDANYIHSIPKDAFYGLYQLQELVLSGNIFNESVFENGVLNIPTLHTLHLVSCGFYSIPEGLPPNLLTLYFDRNHITALKSDSFVSVPHVQSLSMQGIQLTIIEAHAFSALPNLQEIDISHNNISDGSFLPSMFSKNQRLSRLEIRVNSLRHFPNISCFPPSLRYLTFEENEISFIPTSAFRNLENLQELELPNNLLLNIEADAFRGLSNLTYLNLQNNNIGRIDAGAINTLQNIQEIWINNNNLATLQFGTFDLISNPNLTTVAIKYNPWVCDCHLRWLREFMDIHQDIIVDWYIVTCYGPPALQGTRWIELKPEDFVCKEIN